MSNRSAAAMLVLTAAIGLIADQAVAQTHPLETTYWKAVEIAGKPVPPPPAKREAHLVFEAGGRVSGSDSCNRLSGTVTIKDANMSFGRMAGTLMACMDSAGIEQPFRSALENAARFTLAGDRLELFDKNGTLLAAFEGRAQAPETTTSPLQGTAWRLVRFRGGDDTILTPDDSSKYTIEFGAGGRLAARIDCNRGSGSWKTTSAGQVELGPLALTRAKCPEGSLHDRIVKQWSGIRSFLVKDGHLFLVLMADGGTYEFEPAPAKP